MPTWAVRNFGQNKASRKISFAKIFKRKIYKNPFFEKAAFYGGTALRIFHGLDRFSEDPDFSQVAGDLDFSSEKYQDAILNEFAALGIHVSISEKQKAVNSKIIKWL